MRAVVALVGVWLVLVPRIARSDAAPAAPPAPAPAAPAAPVDAARPESHALEWNESWPRFRAIEYGATAVLGPFALYEYYAFPPRRQARWVGGILFDDAARDAFRLRSPSALGTIRALSDAVDTAAVILAVGVDSVIVPLVRGSWDVTWQTLLMDIEAFAVSSIVAITGYDTVGRGRPLYEDCQKSEFFDAECTTSPTASFPSGHVNEAFTAAGLSCVNHKYLPLYGSRLADTLACARDLTLATLTGVMRIMGDRHWTTDVIAGGAFGFGFGYGMPTLLHYAVPWHTATDLMVTPMPPGPTGQMGLVAAGRF